MEKIINKVIKIMKLKVKDVNTVPESYSSKVCSLVLHNNKKVILKIPYNKDKLIKEYKILQLLEGKLPTPKILDFWEGNDEIPGALILSYIEGSPITSNINEKVAYQMGELLAKLHDSSIDKNKLGDAYRLIYTEKDKWWELIKKWFESCVEDCKHILNKEMIDKSIKLFNLYYEKLPEPDYPSMVHMDYRPGNILIKDSKVIGLLDFETARIGSADVDFSKIKLCVWDTYPNTKESFLSGYSSQRQLPDLQKTLPFYLLFNTFTGVGWCVRRGKIKDSFYNQNIGKLKEIIKESKI